MILDPVTQGVHLWHQDDQRLNVATWQERSCANGPGARYVLWLQGCLLRCPGCINADMQAWVPRHWLSVDLLAARICAVPGLDGVTLTGGEPWHQTPALIRLCQRLRRAGLSIVCYSGYTLDQLQQTTQPCIRRLLDLLDILIDGPYVQAEAANLRWRGSHNQRIHFLSQRYRHVAGQIDRLSAQMEIEVGQDQWRSTGFWPKDLVEEIQQQLSAPMATPAGRLMLDPAGGNANRLPCRGLSPNHND